MNRNAPLLKLIQRLAAKADFKLLSRVWNRSSLGFRQKIRIFRALIESKLMYGLESAQLNASHKISLNRFQLRGLRKILKMKTTYIDRNNTNAAVLLKANQTD